MIVSLSSCARGVEASTSSIGSSHSSSSRMIAYSTSCAGGEKGWTTSPSSSEIKYNDASTCCASSRLFFLFMGMLFHRFFITRGLILTAKSYVCLFQKDLSYLRATLILLHFHSHGIKHHQVLQKGYDSSCSLIDV